MKSYIAGGLKTTIAGPSETKDMEYVSGFKAPKPVHRDGEVQRVVVSRNVQIQDGSLTVKLLKNGSETGQDRSYTSADPYNYQYHVWTLSSAVSVSVGDTLGIRVVSSSDFDKGLASDVDLHVGIEVIS